tara:strand:- start:755 stop:1360 length:606 start_codon:yes stop_codon:yes gene_type:complete
MFSKAFSYKYKDFRLVNLTGNNCFFPADSLSLSKIPGEKCKKNMIKANEWIFENSSFGDVLVIANSSLIRYFQVEKQEFANYLDNFKSLINTFKKKGIRIYLIASPPIFNKVKDSYCSQEWFRPINYIRKECFIKRDKLDKNRGLFFSAIEKEIQDKNFKIINKNLDFYCDKTICQAIGYLDSDHLLDDFALKIIKKYELN